MLKALLKKQIIEISSFFISGKDGKRRKPMAILGIAVLMVYVLGASGALFWLLSGALCEMFVATSLDWAYFALFGAMSTGFGVIGGVFMAKSKLYEAKDNEMLMAMPIPSWAILFTRIIGVYAVTFLFEALVFVPAFIHYFVIVGFSVKVLALGLMVIFVMPLGAVAICSLLGFLVALLTAKLPYKNLWTIVFFLLFFGAYFLLYSNMESFIEYLLSNGEAVGKTMQTALYPFGQLGKAVTGEWLSVLLFLLIFVGLFAVVYTVISLTYFRIATMKTGERRPKYKEKKVKGSPVTFSLFKKEFWRLIKSPAYLLNASMGTLIMLIVFVMALVQGDLFGMTSEMMDAIPALGRALPLLVAAICCFLGGSNFVSATSVSLEGDSIWLLQSMPVEEKKIFHAKIALHFVVTEIPAMFCLVEFSILLKLSVWYALLAAVTMTVFIMLCACMGLAINLKMPNLHWTNETAAVKQSMSSLVAMLGAWGVVLLPIGLYFAFGKYLPAWGYMLLWLGVFALATAAILVWLYKRGARIFANLK